MILDKVLILKGLGGITALGGTAVAAYYGITSLGGDSPESLIEKAGLKCTFNSNECEITSLESGKKINVKHDTTKEEGKTFTVSASGPKIKVQKNVTEGGYNKNLKLTIEGGDINLTVGTASGTPTITKLEEFETYEIKEDGDKWYLNRKTDALEGKSKALGLPTETGNDCKLPTTDNSPKTCSLDSDKLKKINFEGKDAAGATIDNNGTNTITLTITKTTDTTTYPEGGYKFAFQSNKDITISSSPANKIMKNTNTEFKIKKTENQLTLEKVWTVTKLAEKVGLTCSSESSCTPGDTITGYKNGETTKTNVSVGGSGKSKTISVEKDQGGFNQGFKFTVSQEIELSTNSEKIATDSYEIKEEGGTWYLTKHTATTS